MKSAASVKTAKIKHSAKPPKSKAKNAYELLGEIRKLILENPLRYDQGVYLDHKAKDPIFGPTRKKWPSCGTIGCRAGWVFELTAPEGADPYDIFGYAAKILGLTNQQAHSFFSGLAVDGKPQTKAHAKHGAEGIAEFMKENKKQLQAKKIPRKISRKS